MIFRQLFDHVSGTYSYLIASRRGGEAMIIDPVIEKVDRYLQLVGELDLKLVKAIDTHLHADHITGLGALRDRTHCITVMGAIRARSTWCRCGWRTATRCGSKG
jgi:sulfur dioxygenase